MDVDDVGRDGLIKIRRKEGQRDRDQCERLFFLLFGPLQPPNRERGGGE